MWCLEGAPVTPGVNILYKFEGVHLQHLNMSYSALVMVEMSNLIWVNGYITLQFGWVALREALEF